MFSADVPKAISRPARPLSAALSAAAGSCASSFSARLAAATKRSWSGLSELGSGTSAASFSRPAARLPCGAQRQQHLQGVRPTLDQAGDRLRALGRHVLAGRDEVEAGVVHHRRKRLEQGAVRHLDRRRHTLTLDLERVPRLGGGAELLRPDFENVVHAAAERNQRLARLAQPPVFGRLRQRLETLLDRGRCRREPLADGLDQGRIVDVRRFAQ